MELKGKIHLGWLLLTMIAFTFVTLLIRDTAHGIQIYWHLYIVPLIIAALVYDIPGSIVLGCLSTASIIFWIYTPELVQRLRSEGPNGLSEKELEITIGTLLFLFMGFVLANLSQKVKQDKQKLEGLSIHDRLTGLFNYSYLIDRLEKEMVRSDRYGEVLSLIIFDLDYFKKLNDTYGHETGNLVLMKVAGIISANIRSIDAAARYGGEEFVVILPNTGEWQAVTLAERIRHIIEQTEIADRNNKITVKVTISGGVSSYYNRAGDTTQLIYQADKALYKSKSDGRNRISTFSQITA